MILDSADNSHPPLDVFVCPNTYIMLCQNSFSIWKPLAFLPPNLCQAQVILSEREAERCLIIAIESGLGWEVLPAAPAMHREEQMPAQLRTQKTDAFQKEAGSWVWKIIFRPWSLRQISILQLCQNPPLPPVSLLYCTAVCWGYKQFIWIQINSVEMLACSLQCLEPSVSCQMLLPSSCWPRNHDNHTSKLAWG